MDTEKQRWRRCEDARMTEWKRQKWAATRDVYRVANQQLLSGSERGRPGWFLDMKYQTCSDLNLISESSLSVYTGANWEATMHFRSLLPDYYHRMYMYNLSDMLIKHNVQSATQANLFSHLNKSSRDKLLQLRPSFPYLINSLCNNHAD